MERLPSSMMNRASVAHRIASDPSMALRTGPQHNLASVIVGLMSETACPSGSMSSPPNANGHDCRCHLSSRRGGTHGIGLCRATFAERLLTLDGRVLSGLVLDLPIQFRADQNYN